MVSPAPMNRAAAVVIVFAALGCSPRDVPDPQSPVACTKASCPKGWCALKVTFHSSCPKDLVAEVLLDDALEPKDATGETTFTSVGNIPVGDSGKFWVRSQSWQWGPISFTCKDPKKDGNFTLACNSTASGAAAPTP